MKIHNAVITYISNKDSYSFTFYFEEKKQHGFLKLLDFISKEGEFAKGISDSSSVTLDLNFNRKYKRINYLKAIIINDIEYSLMGKAPYGHIPLNKEVVRSENSSVGFSVFANNKNHGYIDVTVKNLTALFTAGENLEFYRENGIPAIAGSTYRGLLRTLIEIAAHGNFKTFNNENIYRRDRLSNNYQARRPGWLKYDNRKDSYFIIPCSNPRTESGDSNQEFNYEISVSDKFGIPHTGKMPGAGIRTFKFEFPRDEAEPIIIPPEVQKDYLDDGEKDVGGEMSNLLNTAKDTYLETGIPVWYEVDMNDVVSHFGHCKAYRRVQAHVKDAIPEKLWNNEIDDITDVIFGKDEGKKRIAGKVFFESALMTQKEEMGDFSWRILQTLAKPKITYAKNYLNQDKFLNKQGRLNDWLDRNSELKEIRGYKLYFHKTENNNNTSFIEGNWEKTGFRETEYNSFKDYLDENSFKALFPRIKETPDKLYVSEPLGNLTDEVIKNIKEVINNKDNKFQFKVAEVLVKPKEFKGRIRYENLSDIELGALLFYLNLPNDKALKVGMGKPLGLGSIGITCEVTTIDREARYSTLFKEDNSFNLGVDTPLTENDIKGKIEKFEKYVLGGIKSKETSLWDTPRMEELKAMLSFDAKSLASPEWHERTRYQTLEKPNEFKQNDPTLTPSIITKISKE